MGAVRVVMTNVLLFCILLSSLSVCALSSYRRPTGNSAELRKESDVADRFASSSLLVRPQSHDAELAAEIALVARRVRRLATPSVGDVSDQRRAVTVVTRHQQQQQVPAAGQQSQQPKLSQGTWQQRERLVSLNLPSISRDIL